jgi:hypothetical protein
MAIEQSLTYNTSSTVIPGEVSIRGATKDTIVLVTATAAGETLCISADQTRQRNTGYGIIDAVTAAECSGTAWP